MKKLLVALLLSSRLIFSSEATRPEFLARAKAFHDYIQLKVQGSNGQSNSGKEMIRLMTIKKLEGQARRSCSAYLERWILGQAEWENQIKIRADQALPRFEAQITNLNLQLNKFRSGQDLNVISLGYYRIFIALDKQINP
jgi:hypothetical protein